MLSSSSISQIESPFDGKLVSSQDCAYSRPNFLQKNNKKKINNNMQMSLYNSYLSPNPTNKGYSVKMENKFKGQVDMNKVFTVSPFQQNINNKLFSSNNLTNSYSDLCTSASFTTQKSSESFFSSNNNNISKFVQNSAFIIPPNLNVYQAPRKLASSMNCRIDFKNNNNISFNKNLSSKAIPNIANSINNSINQKTIPIYNSVNSFNFGEHTKYNPFIQENINTNFNLNNNLTINNNEIKYFNSQKSIDFSDHNFLKIDQKSNISETNTNNSNGLQKKRSFENNINGENQNRKKSKGHYNKFNTGKENNMNENTVILTMKIKVAKNDCRVFNLKKYDDLFVSLEKFVDLNKIKQELVKPLVNKIFLTLNKIFWLLNNKIGIYDRDYLNSLYKLWIKNNQEMPKTRNKNNSDKSTTSSSNSSDNNNSSKDIKSNSYQNTDNNSYDEGKQRTANSF